jgi:hypothetical protein
LFRAAFGDDASNATRHNIDVDRRLATRGREVGFAASAMDFGDAASSAQIDRNHGKGPQAFARCPNRDWAPATTALGPQRASHQIARLRELPNKRTLYCLNQKCGLSCSAMANSLAGLIASDRPSPGERRESPLRRFAQKLETEADFFAWNPRNPLKTPVSDE